MVTFTVYFLKLENFFKCLNTIFNVICDHFASAIYSEVYNVFLTSRERSFICCNNGYRLSAMET